MTVSIRIFRAIADQHQPPRPLTARARAQRAHILATALDMLAGPAASAFPSPTSHRRYGCRPRR
jgi:hypothetical protein